LPRRVVRSLIEALAMDVAAAPPDLVPLIPAGLPEGLPHYWYPLLQSEELPADRPVGVAALDQRLALWRNAAGEPQAVRDRCPHRSIKLSVGRVLDGELQCLMHGLRFDGAGRCTLIPWAAGRSRQHDRLAVAAYPARELGGYVWVYLGDALRFPPPPLETQVPEELLRPEEFICFRLPTSVWKANWLLAIDGSDGFHAVVMHTDSQAVHRAERQPGSADVPLEDRRVKIIKTSHGVRGVSVDLQGQPLNHGHFDVDVKGRRFNLPCLTSNPITPAPGAAPYVSRLWQFPQDREHTLVVRYLAWKAATPAERKEAERIFERVARQRLEKVNEEDAFAAEAMGEVLDARATECLLAPDEDVVQVRRLLHAAFVQPLTTGERLDNPPGALAFPM
jgi:phenylpropionate dioxygenase-like ring-hydroxylating dioxygenase large terminal subunit